MWTPLGPSPQDDSKGLVARFNQPVTGRVSALAEVPAPAPPRLVLLGAASGGVWRQPEWVVDPGGWKRTNTDILGLDILDHRTGFPSGLIDIGALAVNPKKPNIV